jgi:hypothetical protein
MITMTMTARDYEAIATILARQASEIGPANVRAIARQLADYFITDNRLFDHRHFMAACVPLDVPADPELGPVTVDPTELMPGDVVTSLADHEISGCHCDVRVTVDRGQEQPAPPTPREFAPEVHTAWLSLVERWNRQADSYHTRADNASRTHEGSMNATRARVTERHVDDLNQAMTHAQRAVAGEAPPSPPGGVTVRSGQLPTVDGSGYYTTTPVTEALLSGIELEQCPHCGQPLRRCSVGDCAITGGLIHVSSNTHSC